MYNYKYDYKYFKMDNRIFDKNLNAAQFRLIAVLYSLDRFGTYRVKVRQSVLAKKCGCSVSTVKRNINALIKKDLIYTKSRQYRTNGKLGTYTYTLPKIPKRGYFYVNRKALTLLDNTQTRMYLFLCKCIRSKTRDCWNSYNDIAKALGISRNSAIKSIRELLKLNVIERRYNYNHKHRSDREDFYNDNTYIVSTAFKSHSEYRYEEAEEDIPDFRTISYEGSCNDEDIQQLINELQSRYDRSEKTKEKGLPLRRSSPQKIADQQTQKAVTIFYNYSSQNSESQGFLFGSANFYDARAGP